MGPMEEAKRSKHCIDQDSRFSLKLWKENTGGIAIQNSCWFSLIFPQPCLFDTSVGKALVDVVERHGKLFLSTTRSDPRRMTERHVPPVDGSWITFKYGFIQVRLKISQLYQLSTIPKLDKLRMFIASKCEIEPEIAKIQQTHHL